ncbi:hypothetical protein O181_002383 [Austropuccinia psidii MF-1]|uniref:Retroviral polymerase SH3-like domain-containing protein n=1 Tax=Austropuccinia psidii MF-1 TaxID=1389203 RepID=A0A9Q3GCK7_9BASI|nr:hypothetical protein [Austropuccinia psidii MF-1]
MLQVFGATSFIHDHNFKKNLLARAVTGYHLGIAEDLKGWIFWIPQKKIVARSVSAKFDEQLFYRPDANQIKSIQVHNLFDNSIIDELVSQDKLITKISSATNLNVMLPTTYQEAIQLNERDEWIGAINDELESMVKEDVFETVELKRALAEVPHESILSTKWVFVKKPERYKARLVAQGFKQIQGIN